MPPTNISQLSHLIRYRFKLTCSMSSENNRLQNCHTVSNIQLGNVVYGTFDICKRTYIDLRKSMYVFHNTKTLSLLS
jgi:hypothetical protein